MYRRLGFGLDEIAALVADPDIDPTDHLLRQRELLVRRGDELAGMYVSDERFKATFDAVAPGLAEYVSTAILANADARS